MLKSVNIKPARWVVMGVSGCGKSSVGLQLAGALNVPFLEGDSYHRSPTWPR
jgi:shikimate kinase